MEVPNDIQQEIMQFQQLQEQYQLFATQRAQMELQLTELGSTMEKLTTVDEGTPLYQNVGAILIKVDQKAKLVDELTERKEKFTRRIDSMKEQEERLKKRLESIGNELNQKIKDSGFN